MTHEIIDGMSRADIAFRVRSGDLPCLFREGARALIAIMIENIETIARSEHTTITCESPELDILYYDFLQEMLYQKDAGKLLLLPERVVIETAGARYRLICDASGERIDRMRHHFIVDIKAVTLHGLSVTKRDGVWTATAVVDV